MKASSKYLKILVVLIFLLCLLAMSRIEPAFKELSGGAGTLDMRLGYDASEVYELYGKLGTEGRNLYVVNFCIDFVFILCYLFVQKFILEWAMGKELRNTGWRRLYVTADLRCLFDVTENLLLVVLLLNYPTQYTVAASVSGYVTIQKFVMQGLWVLAIPVSLIARGLAAGKKRRNRLSERDRG